MSFYYSEYPITSGDYKSDCSDSAVNYISCLSDDVVANSDLGCTGGAVNAVSGSSRPSNIHINPNLFTSSGSLHINKKVFNVNQSDVLRHFNYPGENVSTSCVSKVHYNAKFLKDIQKPPSFERGNLDIGDYVSTSKPRMIHFNPKFALGPASSSFDNTQLAMSSNSVTNIHVNSIYKEFHQDLHSDNVIKDNERILVNPNPSKIDHKEGNGLKWTSHDSVLHPIDSNTALPQTDSFRNSKYRKVNTQPPVESKTFAVSRFKIQRQKFVKNSDYASNANLVPKTNHLPPRKPKLSGSFKKIGKRKLVRKSMIQSYITSRRCSLPSMMHRSRTLIASRLKLSKTLSLNKYKYVNSSARKTRPVSHFKNPRIPSKSKLKWSRADCESQEFVKIGKRKIVRKSLLQSILEARRKTLYSIKRTSLKRQRTNMSMKTTHRYRFKVTRNVTSELSPKFSAIRRDSSFNVTRKKDSTGVNQFLTSKSFFFRMPPTLRLKIRFEEKRKRLMLLKKVNRIKCSFFNRFGYCKGLDSGSCKKLHDPKAVSICQKFLKGVCSGEGCNLSHKVVPEKMPTCHQFLAGVCVRPSCPFLHVKLSKAQPVCIDFLQGFCSQGDSCTKRHQFICPEWDETASCTKEKCSYPHPQSKTKKQLLKSTKKKSTVAKLDMKSGCDQVDEDNICLEESKSRYFVIDTSSSDEPVNTMIAERKPDMRDGVNSVYDNQSLMSFIPFS